MQLVHDFVVPRPIESAWSVLTDLEQVAPCMPGAQLLEAQGDTYRGTVRVKVGPILAQFAGEARFKELDREAHRAVIEARGKEAGGKGLAAALITAQLTPEGDQTSVHVVTDLTLSGRIAQFGRGAIGEVSAKLLGQFVECLEATVLADPGAGSAGTADAAQRPAEAVDAPDAAPPTVVAEPMVASAAAPVTEPVVRRIDSPAAEPVNLLSSAGPSILKRLIPALVVVLILVLLIIFLMN